ncbi:hypothetical protein [Bacillus sp. REN10]|uniref:hypothetical protein n=1 Tax=Bacillus sp. REN10 TaxID=2782541 RepID=UPI00193BD070|nr:hypothetical protein [Bacillus sp. REN10]
MFGIKEYLPKLYENSTAILHDLKHDLQDLKGQKIKKIWVVWDQFYDEWFVDCPVIIQFENAQMELCAYQMGAFAISFNQIDIRQQPDLPGTEFKLIWTKDKMENLEFAIGQQVKEIEIIEEDSLLFGVGFQLEDGYFAVCNGFDENSIVTEKQEGPHLKQSIV